MRGEGVNRGEVGRREKGERRMEKGEGSTLHNFRKHAFTHSMQGATMCIFFKIEFFEENMKKKRR